MLCQDGSGPLYVKFGRTDHLYGRMRQVGQGSPIPAKWFAFIKVPFHKKGPLEKHLHCYFKDRKVRGEWFKFDANSDADKREFNDGCRDCFQAVMFKPGTWTKVSVAALDAEAKKRQQNYFRVKKQGIVTSADRDRARQKAWKELSSYGLL